MLRLFYHPFLLTTCRLIIFPNEFMIALTKQPATSFGWTQTTNVSILLDSRKISRPKHLGGLGIRLARETNICLLGKLSRDLVQSSKKLWVHLLSNKYFLWIIACFKEKPLGAAPLNGPPSSVLKMCLKMVTNGIFAVVLPHFGSLTRVV